MALACVTEEEQVTLHKAARGARKRLLALIPPKVTSSSRLPKHAPEAATIFIMTVASVSIVMDLQRMGMLSSLREFSKT